MARNRSLVWANEAGLEALIFWNPVLWACPMKLLPALIPVFQKFMPLLVLLADWKLGLKAEWPNGGIWDEVFPRKFLEYDGKAPINMLPEGLKPKFGLLHANNGALNVTFVPWGMLLKWLLEPTLAVLWEDDGPNPPRVWESPLRGGIPYENGPPDGVWKASEVAPTFALDPDLEVDEGCVDANIYIKKKALENCC